MSILLSELVSGIGDEVKIINEKSFDYFARTSSYVDGKKCVFLNNKKIAARRGGLNTSGPHRTKGRRQERTLK